MSITIIFHTLLLIAVPRLLPSRHASDDLAELLTSMQCTDGGGRLPIALLPPETDSAVMDDGTTPVVSAQTPLIAGCWQGIHIGETTRAAAKAKLEAHPWVGAVFESSLALSWHWSGTQPRAIDAAYDGLARIGGGVVEQIRIPTHVRFGDFWVLLGIPQSALLVRPVSISSAYQIVDYPLQPLHIVSTLRCPVDPQDFWVATTTLGIGDIWLTESLNGSRFSVYDQPRWWSRLRLCRVG